jgi:hypothetical protein
MLYTVFYKGRIDARCESNGDVKDHILEMVNFQDISPKDIEVRKGLDKLILEFTKVWDVSVGGC